MTGWTSSRGVVTTNAFDPETDRLDSIAVTHALTGDLLRQSFGFDPGDRITQIADTADPFQNRSFGYDALNRLEDATGFLGAGGAQATLHYGYDALGNIRCKDAPSAPAATSCDGTALTDPPGGGHVARPHVPLTSGGQTVTRDLIGNVTAVGSRSYGYDLAGRLTQVRDAGVTRATFPYDGAGALHRIPEITGASIVERRLVSSDTNPSAVGRRVRLRTPADINRRGQPLSDEILTTPGSARKRDRHLESLACRPVVHSPTRRNA